MLADLINANINEDGYAGSEYSYKEHHHPPGEVDPKEFISQFFP